MASLAWGISRLVRAAHFLFFCGILAIVHSGSAQAAPSFDCAKASTQTEKIICDNADLGDLDAALAKAYAAKLNSLKDSKPGSSEANEAVALRFRQQHWVAAFEYECSLARGDGVSTESLIRSKTTCISRVYRDRIAALAIPAQQPPLSNSEPHPSTPGERDQSVDLKHVGLVYSADDALCEPLAKLYDEFSHKPHPVLDWEGDFKSKFAQIGLTSPSPWKGQSAQTRRTMSGLLRTYYRLDLSGDGKSRLVYVEDEGVGSRGEYGTNVWILKPGSDVTKYTDQVQETEVAQFASDIVEFSIVFDAQDVRRAHAGVASPYFFDKITSPDQRSLPISDRIKDELFIGFGSIVVQRAFSFHDQVIFTARIVGGFDTVLVYKYVPLVGLTDLCYLASEEAARRTHTPLKGE